MPGESSKKRRRTNSGKKGDRTKKQQKKSAKDTNKKPAPIAVAPDGGEYYEAETVVAARQRKGVWEYQVRWKGYGPKFDTWEPATNLCETLHQVALKIRNRLTLSEEKQEAEEKIDPGDKYPDTLDIFDEDPSSPPVYGIKEPRQTQKGPDRISDNDDYPTRGKKESIPDRWEWNDREQVKFREIERINVKDKDARRRVTEARENGVPICLVGHKGWANFAGRWLRRKGTTTETVSPAATSQVTVAELETVEYTRNNNVQQPRRADVTQLDVPRDANKQIPYTQPHSTDDLTSTDMIMNEIVFAGNASSTTQPSEVGLTVPSVDVTMAAESAPMNAVQPQPVDETTIAGSMEHSIPRPTTERVANPSADISSEEGAVMNSGQLHPVDQTTFAENADHDIARPNLECAVDPSINVALAESVTLQNVLLQPVDEWAVAGNTADPEIKQPPIGDGNAAHLDKQDPHLFIVEEAIFAGDSNKAAPVSNVAANGHSDSQIQTDAEIIDDQPPTSDLVAGEGSIVDIVKPPEASDIASEEVGSPLSAELRKQNREATNNGGGCSFGGDTAARNSNVESLEAMPSINQVTRVSDASTQGKGSQDQTKRHRALEDNDDTVQESTTEDHSIALETHRWIDLSEDWEVDVSKMIEDMGEEMVPVVKPRYNEQVPIHASVRLADFLSRCWPSNGSSKTVQRLYLHQYQFPLSNASTKLCASDCHNPLPHDILGEDLLALWQDGNKGNPYQYIFMGRDETMSKLHRDPGGLAISIAPVVGQKEVLLVHRSDGVSCLSHLQASLEKIDLQNFPMVAQARIYKSVIKPGEILLMPQGTFHQCRNITPCLSYSRFHLDTVNLRAFFESCINRDAPEINHEEVLWNCALELSSQLDKYVDALKVLRKSKRETSLLPSPEIVRKVDTLRALRCISRAIYMRYERGDTLSRTDAAGGSHRVFSDVSHCEKEAERWGELLRDVDSTLHDFRYRNRSSKPAFRAQCQKSVFFKSDLEKDLASQPKVSSSTECLAHSDSLTVGREVEVNFQGRLVAGEVKGIEVAMPAAFLHFDNLPAVYDEFLPFEALRLPVAGEACVEILPDQVKAGIAVVYPMGTEEYRAVVVSRVKETFVLLELIIGSTKYERWLRPTSILGYKM